MMRFLTWDKFMHFMYMYAIQITFLLFLGVWSLFASILFPLAKEIYDVKVLKAKVDMTDFMVSVVAGAVAYFVYHLGVWGF